MVDRRMIGRLGEDAAVEWLEDSGFLVRERNWRWGRYELDIVAERDGELHVVEVKCRADGGLTRPEESITEAKFAALRIAAGEYIERYGIDADVRFDLISVTHRNGEFRVEYIPDAMLAGW